MRPSSPAQIAAVRAGALPDDEEVRPGIHAVALPMPGVPTFSYAYLIEGADGSVVVFDPGWDSEENLSRLAAALTRIGRGLDSVSFVTASHFHPDHLGLAGRLRAASGARVLLHGPEAEAHGVGHHVDAAPLPLVDWGAPAELRPELEAAIARHAPGTVLDGVDGVLADGAELPIPGRRIAVVATPGHTSGHVGLHDAESGVVFTGDAVLPTINPGIGLGGRLAEPIAAALDSLDRLVALAETGADEALPGHEFRFDGLADRARALIEHHLRRSREVAAALDSDPTQSIWQLAAGLTWTGGFAALPRLALASALAQTAMHRDFVRSAAGVRRLG